MKAYQIKTFLILFLFAVSVYGKADCGKNLKSLSCLYSQLNSLESPSEPSKKVENGSLILSNYNLVVWSSTWCASCQKSQALWEGLAGKYNGVKDVDLNVIVIYDNYHQNLDQIRNKASQTLAYEHFDEKRQLFWWFENLPAQLSNPGKAVAQFVLMAPKDEILLKGDLSSEDHIREIEKKILEHKKKTTGK